MSNQPVHYLNWAYGVRSWLSPLIKLAAAGGFFWMLIFFAIILSDYMERTTLVTGW